MEEELEKTKQSYQTQISAHEKKAHNNWVSEYWSWCSCDGRTTVSVKGRLIVDGFLKTSITRTLRVIQNEMADKSADITSNKKKKSDRWM